MIILDPSTTNCPRCQAGGLAVEDDSYGPFIHCLICGFMADVPKPKRPGLQTFPKCHEPSAPPPSSNRPLPPAVRSTCNRPGENPDTHNRRRDVLWRHM